VPHKLLGLRPERSWRALIAGSLKIPDPAKVSGRIVCHPKSEAPPVETRSVLLIGNEEVVVIESHARRSIQAGIGEEDTVGFPK
jgi:hypothetical protein